MRRVREALRLHLQAMLSYCEVRRALKISKSVVGKCVSLARVAGVDCAVVDAQTGAVTRAQIFVAVLGASNYTYACATPHQTTDDWIDAQVLALEFSFPAVRSLARSTLANPEQSARAWTSLPQSGHSAGV